MHMNSAPHLLKEDRPEFERVLNEALRSADRHPELAAMGERLTTAQLRTMALSASAAISACAANEYQAYVEMRERFRAPAPRGPHPAEGGGGSSDPEGDAAPGLGSGPDPGPGPGPGIVAVVAVLAPVLAGAASVIFLIFGYALRMIHPVPSIAQPMVTAGWLFAALTAAGILLAAVGLLLTAVRNGASAIRGAAALERAEEVARARETWRRALLERGVLPFLHEALTEAAASPPSAAASPHPPRSAEGAGRTPHLGYSRPGFSTDGDGSPTTRPRFSSPDFTSPDFGGPEHGPE
ncbi:hypothetical protein LRS74_16245 [Streptomyces sp. LX-29]|uniref:hypothetical protein n=1 Tax=Streptomyces sp. LX-29 TaxID=2900152 RepID=UPI00240DC82A|nr:hypothetical protein [Streptomyces sp. LX-29]WFB11673.1 hypothetical protein LRS74_16245 [Streptomyces sp. LX-29]